MKIVSLMALLILSIQSNASILDAQEYFDAKKYQASFIEYQKLAKLGNVRAQYNSALMTFKGLGTDKNNTIAYAWARIAADIDPEINQLLSLIKNDLKEFQIPAAKLKADLYKKKHGHMESRQLYGALEKGDSDNIQVPKESSSSHNGYRISRNKVSKKKLDYPQKAIKKSGQGWVELSYSIYPDGTVQDINILNQYPHELFAPAAIDYIAKQKFDFFKNNKISQPESELYTSFRFKFLVEGRSLLGSKAQRQIDKVLKSALAGSLEAQYTYTNLYYSILNKGGGISGKIINSWLLRSAQFGIAEAQYRLGYSIFYGISCNKEKQKGLDWILRAAENGVAKAQYMAYYLLKTEELNNFTSIDSYQWLLKAAENNSNNGRLKYAKLVVKNRNSSQKDVDLAFNYLDKYAIDIAKTADWYQTHALLSERSNNYTDAEKSIKKAIKIAKKSHWDLAELKAQQRKIKSRI